MMHAKGKLSLQRRWPEAISMAVIPSKADVLAMIIAFQPV